MTQGSQLTVSSHDRWRVQQRITSVDDAEDHGMVAAGGAFTGLLDGRAWRYHPGVWMLALGLLTCLVIDVSNPLLPGAVRFDEETIYWLRAERSNIDEPVLLARVPLLRPRPPDFASPPPRVTAARRRLRPPRPLLRRTRVIVVARAAPGPDEDH
jgi:hypothetical protein